MLTGQTPVRPEIFVYPFEEAVFITWDSLAEGTTNAPFSGYRLYRGRLPQGPFTMIREWKGPPPNTQPAPSTLPHSLFDIGDDNNSGSLTAGEGLRNELRYYYYLSAYADSVVSPYRPFMESPSETLMTTPRSYPSDRSPAPVTLSGMTGVKGFVGNLRIIRRSAGNFRNYFSGKSITVSVTTFGSSGQYIYPIVVRSPESSLSQSFFFTPGLSYRGDSASAGAKSGTFVMENLFSLNSFDIAFDWQLTQLTEPLAVDTVITISGGPTPDTPLYTKDTVFNSVAGFREPLNTLGESTYEVEFLPGGTDTVNAAAKQIFQYLNVKVTELNSGRTLSPFAATDLFTFPGKNEWAIARYAKNMKSTSLITINKGGVNKYYYRSPIDTATIWEFANVLSIENLRIVMDFANMGRTLGHNWPVSAVKGVTDFSAGDKVRFILTGGVRGALPFNSLHTYAVGNASVIPSTKQVLDQVRIVPNPYLVRHEAQRSAGDPVLRFDYLPEKCSIRIYTVSMELVKELQHSGGSTEQWDLRNSAGNRVGSQLLIALIQGESGETVIKKFAVVLGE